MRFAADENFNGDVLDGLRKRLPDVDIVRVQDTDMVGAPDPKLLEWLAGENRILLTHDVQTMPGYAYERVRAGLPMPGVIEVNDKLPVGLAIEELEVTIGAGNPEDFENRVYFVKPAN